MFFVIEKINMEKTDVSSYKEMLYQNINEK